MLSAAFGLVLFQLIEPWDATCPPEACIRLVAFAALTPGRRPSGRCAGGWRGVQASLDARPMPARSEARMIQRMHTSGPVRRARAEDCEAIARIYNEGIAERRSTFETEPRSEADVEEWLGSQRHPVLVAERDGVLVGWARISPYSSRPCYAGVGEGSIYVRASERGRGLGSALAAALVGEAERAGYYKILGKLFADNDASRRLVARHGFREVGVHLRHGRLDGDWRDVLVVERLLLLIGGNPRRP
jgi:L-amino acid N-acyltransferase YncA